jgi:hypothetical protein
MRRLLLPLVAAMLITCASAQDTDKPVKTIRDVKIGMPRESVLTGLSDRYNLQKSNVRTGLPEFEQWYAVANMPKEDESGKITFQDGKAFVVDFSLYPPMTGEAVRFAQRLFTLLYSRADPPSSPNILESKFYNSRYATVPIELRDDRGDKLETLHIGFTIGQQLFDIEISKLDGLPDSVEIHQSLVSAEMLDIQNKPRK